MISSARGKNCNTMQHTTTHCDTNTMPATHCNTRQHTATHCNTLQHTATCCNMLQHAAARCNTLQHTATQIRCNTLHRTLQHTTTQIHCNALQHTATHCSTMRTQLCAPSKTNDLKLSHGDVMSRTRTSPTTFAYLCRKRFTSGNFHMTPDAATFLMFCATYLLIRTLASENDRNSIVNICIYVYRYTLVCKYMYVYTYISVYIYICACVCIHIYVCIQGNTLYDYWQYMYIYI